MKAKLLAIAGDMSAASKRKQLAEDVFKPSYILPTISVEQQGMIELREVPSHFCEPKHILMSSRLAFCCAQCECC